MKKKDYFMAKRMPGLIKIEQIDELGPKEVEEIYQEHINPGQVHYYKILGYNKIQIKRAIGVYYYDQGNNKILDFAGGVGAIGLGHNHPKIIEARKKFEEDNRHEIGQWFLSQYVAVLAKNLASICPGDLNYVLLGNCGSESMEGALKIVEKYHGPAKNKFIYASKSFHGRTKGALSITDSDILRSTLRLLENDVKVPFGEAAAIDDVLRKNKDIGGVVLEPVQGGAGVIIPPKGYLKEVRRLCDRYGVLLVLDEIQCGFGRTGKMFAFEHENIVPDIFALSKSLSGGKTAISACIARKKIYKKAFSNSKDWIVNSPSTLGGMGEACITAIEAINVLFEENLLENIKEMGAYFLGRLKLLQDKYPKIIKEVRGLGLMLAIEFHDISNAFISPLNMMVSPLDNKLKGSITGFIGSILLHQYKVIIGFTGSNRNVMRLHPPFITQKEHIDYFVDSMDDILDTGISGIVKTFIKLKL